MCCRLWSRSTAFCLSRRTFFHVSVCQYLLICTAVQLSFSHTVQPLSGNEPFWQGTPSLFGMSRPGFVEWLSTHQISEMTWSCKGWHNCGIFARAGSRDSVSLKVCVCVSTLLFVFLFPFFATNLVGIQFNEVSFKAEKPEKEPPLLLC